MANAEVFDSYFRRADLDKDGRISGQEAVGFFQGAGLPQMTLAKIWQFADQGRTGFLSRVEFYNALKLVTVAQTGREITPELVRAALTGPAAAQIPPPRINAPGGQGGGGPGASAAVARPPGPGPVRAPGPPAAQGVANGQESQARGLQGSSGGMNARQAGVVGNGLAGSQGAPAKQFSPHTNSAPSAPVAQGGYGGAAKQLAPQTNSLSAGGSGVAQLTPQTSSLSRYPPSAGQVQVPPTGFAQQGWARPPAPGGQAVRPSLGSLFTTNSTWPPKESNPASAIQGSGSTSVSSGLSATTTPGSGQSRAVAPAASSAATVTTSKAGAGQGPTASSTKGGPAVNAGLDLFGATAGQGPTASSTTGGPAVNAGLDLFGTTAGQGPTASSTKDGPAVGAGLDLFGTTAGQGPTASSTKDGPAVNAGMDLFSSGFKATPPSGTGSNAAGSGSEVAKPGFVTAAASQAKPAVALPLDESMFSAPGVPSVKMLAPGAGRGVGAGATPQGGPRGMDMGAGPGARPQGGPVAAVSWPQMSENDVQRYTRVFTKVDTDKDGKITGEQARELFLSWQLPRGVLKQVWDLSDQDNDSMLSVREFCTALYFMERFREGRALPSTLPAGIHPDGSQVSAGTVAQGPGGQSAPVWRHIPGPPQSASAPAVAGPRAVAEAPAIPTMLQMPERAVPAPGQSGPEAAGQEPYKSKVPALDEDSVNQLSRDEQEMLKTKHKAAEEADKKVFELDREIQDYKEKIELYRTKLQEIILFKSKCDNQLNEVKESVATEIREMDALGKKYDQRFKAAGEVSSRLQAEEAAFRDIQEKKMELYNAIAKLDKGGDGNESAENRANGLSGSLDDLKKTLYERGRALGVKPKSAVPIEVSTGFEGVPDNAMEWVEEWDKFDDEGFTNVRDIMDDLGDDAPSTTKAAYSAPWGNGESLFDDGFDFSSEGAVAGEDFKTGHDEEGFSTSEKGRAFEDSPEDGASTSHSVQKDYAFNSSVPSGRFSSAVDSDGDAFHGEAAFDSVNESFGQGQGTFDARDPFGDSGSAWGFHDEDSNADFRASWGQASGSSVPSTQTSMDLTSSRGQTRFGRERGSIAESLDMDSLRVSSPRGPLFDGSIRTSSPGGFDSSIRESSPGARGFGGLSSPGWSFDRNGNGHEDYKSAFTAFDSPKSNAFGSPRSNAFGSPKNAFGSPKNAFGSPKNSSSFFGNSSFDATPSLFGGSPGASKREDPFGSAGGSFLRFDSFGGPGSPAAAGRGSGGGEFDHSGMGHDGEKSIQRFDSSNSMRPERERRRGFGSDDDSDPFGAFGSSGPFGGGPPAAKQTNVWSAF